MTGISGRHQVSLSFAKKSKVRCYDSGGQLEVSLFAPIVVNAFCLRRVRVLSVFSSYVWDRPGVRILGLSTRKILRNRLLTHEIELKKFDYIRDGVSVVVQANNVGRSLD